MEISHNKKPSLLSLLFKVGIPLVISVGLCWLLFRDFDFADMWHIITTECDFRWIIGGLIIATLSHVFRAMRWRLQLQALGIDVPLFYVVLSIFGTYAVNLVFPRLGELWRTGYIARRQNAPFAQVFGSMVADRTADTITVALLTLLAFALSSGAILSYLGQNEELVNDLVAWVTYPGMWFAIALICALAWRLAHTPRGKAVISRLRGIFKGLWQGFSVVTTMPGRGKWLLLTVAIWGCYFGQLAVAMEAFEFTSAVQHGYGLQATLVAFVLSSISMGVPSNGGIGPWQWAIIFALGIYGVDAAPAGAFANLVLGCNTLLLIALGLFTFACIALDRRDNKQHIDNNKQEIEECQK